MHTKIHLFFCFSAIGLKYRRLQKLAVDAVVKIKEELVAENPENVMLERFYGDPCMPPTWQGLTCEERNNSFVITKL